MPLPPILQRHASQFTFWFLVLACAGVCTLVAGCWLLGVAPSAAVVLNLLILAVAVGALASWLLERLVLARFRSLLIENASVATEREAMRQDKADRSEQQRRLRHDIRGVLSPVLLTADRLSNHADPAVKRSGEILSRTVDRATAILADAAEAASNPPAGP